MLFAKAFILHFMLSAAKGRRVLLKNQPSASSASLQEHTTESASEKKPLQASALAALLMSPRPAASTIAGAMKLRGGASAKGKNAGKTSSKKNKVSRKQRFVMRPVAATFSAAGAPGSFLKPVYSTLDQASVTMDITQPVNASIGISMKDPPRPLVPKWRRPPSQEPSYDMYYAQKIAGVGELGAKLWHSGDWLLCLTRQQKKLGTVQGLIRGGDDWSLQVDNSYPAYQGLKPSVSYGINQEGAQGTLAVDANVATWRPFGGVKARYEVANQAGVYSIEDLQHGATATVTSGGGNHMLEASMMHAGGDETWQPGSMKYMANGDPGTLETTLTTDRIAARLGLRKPRLEVHAAMGYKANQAGKRPIDLGVIAPKLKAARGWDVSAFAHFNDAGKPILRFGVGK